MVQQKTRGDSAADGFWRRLFLTQKKSSELETLARVQTWLHTPGKPVWMRRDYQRFAQEAYARNVVAHRAVQLVAAGAASIPWKLVQAGQGVTEHPLLQLLMRPNPFTSGKDYFEAAYASRLLGGNAYLHRVGPQGQPPLELHQLRPDRVAVVPGNDGHPVAYVYSIGQVERKYPIDRLSGECAVLHFKTYHPLDDWYGMSPVEAAAYSIDQHNQAAVWNQALLQNGARPSGALVVTGDATLSDEQFSRLKEQIDSEYSGASNAGRPVLLEGGLDWREMGHSPKDMDFLNVKHSAARDIALAFGVPPQLLGIPGDNTYSNLAEARLALWEQTILPLAGAMVEALNHWLAPRFGRELRLSLDTDNISALAPRREAVWNRVKDAAFLSDEEKRQAVGYSA